MFINNDMIPMLMSDPVDKMRRVNPGYGVPKGKIRFSKTEILHIVVSIVVLSAAFAILMRGRSLHLDPTMNILLIIGLSFLLVICSFLFHELGHKFVAQRYRIWSEFRAYPMGLVMALITAFMGFLFAAPGAVYIEGNITKEMNGKISLAGPSVNFAIATFAIIVCLFIQPGTLAYVAFFMLAYLNAFLGLFNMIPIMPFDGSKIIKWNLPVYIIAVVIGIADLILALYVI